MCIYQNLGELGKNPKLHVVLEESTTNPPLRNLRILLEGHTKKNGHTLLKFCQMSKPVCNAQMLSATTHHKTEVVTQQMRQHHFTQLSHQQKPG